TGPWVPEEKLTPAPGRGQMSQLPTGPVTIGCDEPCAYDNEQPRHEIWQAGGRIARHPVTNAQYLALMEDGGYQRAELWSAAGWAWLRDRRVNCPAAWRRAE